MMVVVVITILFVGDNDFNGTAQDIHIIYFHQVSFSRIITILVFVQ